MRRIALMTKIERLATAATALPDEQAARVGGYGLGARIACAQKRLSRLAEA